MDYMLLSYRQLESVHEYKRDFYKECLEFIKELDSVPHGEPKKE